ncbi:MAG: hypothetical protein Q7S54_01565 [bacterium]|nr:hypothetical protein [bacterium]
MMLLRVLSIILIMFVTAACGQSPAPAAPTALTAFGSSDFMLNATTGGGFDQYGYNRRARIFNGTGSSWCLARGAAVNCLGIYSPDKLVMKWNDEWDRGNAEGWSDPNGYRAWESNEWNGNCAGCSGAVWHYKIQWVGACGADGTPLADGGYCVWGQFEVLQDHGQDPNLGPGHIWFAQAKPGGYGT